MSDAANNAGLALAVVGAAKDVPDLLNRIISTVNQIVRRPEECEELETLARTCLEILQNPSATLESKIAKRFEAYLERVLKCVDECRDSTIYRRVIETAFWDRLAGLKREFIGWLAFLSTETVLASRRDLLKLIETITTGDQNQQIRTKEQYDVLMAKLSILDEIKENQENMRPKALHVDFQESDSRLVVSPSEDNLRGTLKVEDGAAAIPVVCDPVPESLMANGQKGPRHVVIYSRLAENTRVHPFYGIARRDQKLWAVFSDMSSCPTLGDAIQGPKLLSLSFPERLAIAREIALTVSYLHSVEILAKRLSDQKILLQEEDGKVVPYLTDLESARTFKETSTGGGAYDVRYEAPEFRRPGGSRHSIYTDIWSLGIVIWQCISLTAPFGFGHEVTKGDEMQSIVQKVEGGEMPWTQNEPINAQLSAPQPVLDETVQLCRDCCRLVANTRPSATEITNRLSDLISSTNFALPPLKFLRQGAVDRVADANHAAIRKEKINYLTKDEVQGLRSLANNNGDYGAAYQLGLAILLGVAKPDVIDVIDWTESEGGTGILLISDDGRYQEIRCRVAMYFLGKALQGGVKKASNWLGHAHKELGKLFVQQTDQYKKMESLPGKSS